MALSVHLSPYLRPFLQDGQVLYDNGITSTVDRLEPVEDEIVRALWGGGEPMEKLAGLAETHGLESLAAAMDRLMEREILFGDQAQCEGALDEHRSRGLPRVPFLDQVELTNHCPFKCGFCPRGIPDKITRPKGFMELSLFEKLLAQVHPLQARYRPFELHHLGESLLHPEIDRFVEAATVRGLPTELSLNPVMLDPDLAGRLLRAGVKRLVLSLDGTDDATLMAIRGPVARYGKSERHVDALLELVAAMPSPPVIVIQMLDLHRNRHQREAFLERYGKSGLPSVHAVIKDLDGPDPDLGQETKTPLVHLCGYPWRSVVVLWDGRVVPCCRDDDARLVLGDLRVQTLESIWNGRVAAELRARHAAGRIAGGHLCHGCAWSPERFAAAAPSRHPDRARPDPYKW